MKLIKNICSCGCGYTELMKNGELLLCGDAYHDKIYEQIIGYQKALTDNNIEFEIIINEITCPYCEE